VSYALEIVTLIVGGVLMLALLPRGPWLGRHRRSKPAPVRPADLRRLEILVGATGLSAAETHAALRPVLRGIASASLNRRGVRLAGNPDAARELLGDELWDLVRPGRPRPVDGRAQGATLQQLAQMTDRLEQL
jgi:hypothetical protein